VGFIESVETVSVRAGQQFAAGRVRDRRSRSL